MARLTGHRRDGYDRCGARMELVRARVDYSGGLCSQSARRGLDHPHGADGGANRRSAGSAGLLEEARRLWRLVGIAEGL